MFGKETSADWSIIGDRKELDVRGAHLGPYCYPIAIDLFQPGLVNSKGIVTTISRWFRDEFCQAKIEATKHLEQGDVPQILEENTRKIPAGSDGVMFLPYLMEERSLIWDAKASGTFVGLSLFHTRAHLYRAVLEGVSFALKHNIEAGTKGAQSLDNKLIVVGGAAHSDLWMQIIADVTGYPVYTIEENVEAALGAALLAAVGIGLVDDKTNEKGWVTLVPRTFPDTNSSVIYSPAFPLYRALKLIMH